MKGRPYWAPLYCAFCRNNGRKSASTLGETTSCALWTRPSRAKSENLL
ncbi:hypothetical protein SALBM311S_05066 [Streptomyces alboniger]